MMVNALSVNVDLGRRIPASAANPDLYTMVIAESFRPIENKRR